MNYCLVIIDYWKSVDFVYKLIFLLMNNNIWGIYRSNVVLMIFVLD